MVLLLRKITLGDIGTNIYSSHCQISRIVGFSLFYHYDRCSAGTDILEMEKNQIKRYFDTKIGLIWFFGEGAKKILL